METYIEFCEKTCSNFGGFPCYGEDLEDLFSDKNEENCFSCPYFYLNF